MEINYYRHPNVQGEDDSWESCQFTHETELTPFSRIASLVTLNGQPILRQHHSTYLTGKDTCRAHHFAKFLAIQVLSGTTENHPSSTPSSRQGCQGITGCQPVQSHFVDNCPLYHRLQDNNFAIWKKSSHYEHQSTIWNTS